MRARVRAGRKVRPPARRQVRRGTQKAQEEGQGQEGRQGRVEVEGLARLRLGEV